MTLDQYGIAHFFEGGDADSAAANDAAAAAAADAGVGDGSGGIDLGSFADVEASAPLSSFGLDEPSNLTQADLNAISNAGLGSLQGINPNNPTQSVDEAIAANNFHAFLNVAVPALMGLAVPGLSTVTTAAQTLGNLASGATTVGQAVAGLGLGVVAQAIGVPPGTLNAALNGNLGQVVANTTMASAPAVIGAITGVPAGMVGFGMNVSGLGQQGNQAIAGTVNEALGVTPSNAALGSVAQSIDEALGITGGSGGSGGTAGAIGTSPGDFGPGGEFAPPTPTDSPTASPQAAGGSSALIAALLAAGLEEKDEDEPEKPEPVLRRFVAPYGLMYGLEDPRMYA